MDGSESALIGKRIIWEKCTNTWSIPGIGEYWEKRLCTLFSPKFSSCNGEIEWKLAFLVRPIELVDYISIKIKFQKYDPQNFVYKGSVTLLDSNQVEIKSCSLLESSNYSFKEAKFMKKDILQSRVPDGEIHIYFEIYSKITEVLINQNIVFEPPLSEIRLGFDLLALLDSGNYSDITLTSSDGKEFKVHKNILTTRSPVFAAMLEHDMLENRSGQITITDFDSETIDLLLRFIYSGKVDLQDFEVAITLLDAAEKYQLHDLKKICLLHLTDNLKTSNAGDLLLLSHKEFAKDLKDPVMNFIVHKFEKFSKKETESLIEIIHPELMADLWKRISGRL